MLEGSSANVVTAAVCWEGRRSANVGRELCKCDYYKCGYCSCQLFTEIVALKFWNI